MKLRPLAAHGVAMVLSASALPAAELIRLEAGSLPSGTLSSWPNHGALGGSFDQGTGFRMPVVEDLGGVRGVSFDGNADFLTGPLAPASVNGNGDRTVIAWLFNPAVGSEETIIAWGRRNGPDKTLSAFFHGSHDTWGCFGGWGSGDVGWSNRERTGSWTCCGFVYDGASGVFRAYTDGELSTTKAIGPLDTWAVDTGGSPLPIRLAGQSNSDGSATSTNGGMTLARVRVYDTAFTEGQVVSEFAAEAADFGLSPLLVVRFTADPPTIYRGESTSLSWEVAGASTVSIDPGVGTTAGGPVVVSPTESTTYTLTASDGSGQVGATVTVNVLPGVPVAESATVVVPQDTPTGLTLVASDPNTPVSSLGWEILDAPANGELSGTAPELVYTPDPGFSGGDFLTFRATDDFSASNPATVTLIVDPPPTPPSATALSESSISTGAVAGSFLGHLTAEDPNHGDVHHFELVAGPGDEDNERFSIVGNQLLAAGSFAGEGGASFSLRVRATDAGGLFHEEVLVLAAEEVPPTVVINELFYDPPDNRRTEFIELHNPTDAAVQLAGWRFTSGIDYTFPPFTVLEPGAYLVVALDPAAFADRFGFTPLYLDEDDIRAAAEHVGTVINDGLWGDPKYQTRSRVT